MRRSGPRFCIIGIDSAIGVALARRLEGAGIETIGSTRRTGVEHTDRFTLDLLDEATLNAPDCDVLVLAAAMTRLADCRADPQRARQANVLAPIRLAQQAAAKGAFTIFYSTNQAFDGSRAGFAVEDAPRPRSFYGKMKVEVEQALLELGSAAILRLTKPIHRDLPLFQGWRRKLLAGETIEAFDDMPISPIAFDKVIVASERIGRARAAGVWHLGGPRDVPYFEIARHLAVRLGVDPALVLPANAAHAGIPPEERPAHTALALGAIEQTVGFRIEDSLVELDIGLGLDPRAPDERAA